MRYTKDELVTLTRDYIQNDDIAESVLLRYLNAGAGILFSRIKTHVQRAERTFTLVANVDTYPLPVDFSRVVSATVTVGSHVYPIWPVDDQRQWDRFKTDVFTSEQPTFMFPRFDQVEFYPTPSTDNVITIKGEIIPKELSVADYTTGTVLEITEGSKIVKGLSTNWTDAMVGRFFQISPEDGDGNWYKISARVSATEITLFNDYQGATQANPSSVSYTIGEQLDLPEELHEGPAKYAAMRYFQGNRKNRGKYLEFKGEFDETLKFAESRFGTRTVYPIQGSRIRTRAFNANNFPRII